MFGVVQDAWEPQKLVSPTSPSLFWVSLYYSAIFRFIPFLKPLLNIKT